MFVANKIKQLIDNKFQVYDAKAKEKRDIKYKDIVVLLRSTKISAPIFEKEIIKLGIPVFFIRISRKLRNSNNNEFIKNNR